MRRCRAPIHGFTLVELLVVMAVIAILAGLTTVGLRMAQKQGQSSAVKHDLSMVVSAAETFAREMGDYPPTSLEQFGVGTNGENEGNESLFACLQTRKKNGPFLEDIDESRWANLDEDTLSADDLRKILRTLDWVRPGDRLLEYTDVWGQPLVYIHHRDYGKAFTYRDPMGGTFTVEAAKSEATGGWAAPTSFQLWSIGPDGVNQNGGGDDICAWKS